MNRYKIAIFLFTFLFLQEVLAAEHGIAMYGEPKYPLNFTHFDYTDPDAKKGGSVRMAAIGTFDSLNSHILKGVAAASLGWTYDTLLTSSDDEPFSRYGLLAEKIELAEDRGSVTFTLREEARWHDGKKITADDVVFSFNTLMSEGHPFLRAYYRDVQSVEKMAENKVSFIFADKTNRELPLIVGDMPILSKHYWKENDFSKSTLTPPLGSGPYKIDALDAGKWIRYKRVEDYWGKDLPVNKGRYNFDEVTYYYYRDATVAVEAFKAGEYDFRNENISKVWNNSYNIPEVEQTLINKEKIPHKIPTGMQAFVYNTRRGKFSDVRVRKALAYAFDFEWTNKNLFNGAYTRTKSYFSNSEFASHGLPEEDELKLLEPFHDKLPREVFEQEYNPPATNGSGIDIRTNLLKARDMLQKSGWDINKEGLLENGDNSEIMEIEFLLNSPSFERVIAPVIQNMKKLGITATMRTVDSAQYIKRVEDFDFDIVVNVFGQSNAPGNEQIDYWHSSKADVKGSRNLAGIKNEVVDALVEKILTAETKEDLLTATRSLDRVLLHGHYVIPNWYFRFFRVIYWNKFGRPKTFPKYALGFENWWIDQQKLESLQKSGKK